MRTTLLALGWLLGCLGFALAWSDVNDMAATERDVASELESFADLDEVVGHRLIGADIAQGQEVLFELCAFDADLTHWAERSVEIYFVDDVSIDRASKVPVTTHIDEMERRGDDFCLTAVHWQQVLVSGEYAIGLDFKSIDASEEDTRLRGRILAWRGPSQLGRAGLLALLLGMLVFMAGLTWPPPAWDPDSLEAMGKTRRLAPGGPALRIAIATALLLVAMFALGLLGGSPGVVALRGAALAAVQVALAYAFVHPEKHERRGDVLALRGVAFSSRLRRVAVWASVLVAGFVVIRAGRFASGLIPSTHVSPIELFISAPSGSLALGIVALCVPLAEEVFFRGLVYGVMEKRYSKNIATFVAIVVFALFHLPQQWGAWGAFASVLVAGIGFTFIRRWTGSTLASAVAHLLHNALITLVALY